jgi:hypothetical protein
MATVNFGNFAERTSGLLNSDYIIGYDPTVPTEFRTNVGNLLSGGTLSEKIQYALLFNHASTGSTGMANNATLCFGQVPDFGPISSTTSPSPTAAFSCYIAGSGTIKYASVAVFTGNNAATEDTTLKIVKANSSGVATTSTITSTLKYNTFRQSAFYTLNTPLLVSQTDRIWMQLETPTYATTPTNVRHMVQLYIV